MSSKPKVLIIEDDLYIREVYEEVLKDAGYDITTAVDGQEGLVKAQQGGYALILLDVMMPKMDGLEVLKALNKNPAQQPNGNVVLLTNLAHDSIIKEAQSLGAFSYLVKSDLNPDQLVQKVKEYLK